MPEKKKEVKLVCPIREMAYFDKGRNEFVAEFSIPYEVYVGTSSLREDLWVREVCKKGCAGLLY